MGGGGKRHRDPIPMPGNDERPFEIDRDQGVLQPPTADTSAYQPGTGMGAVVVHHLVTAALLVLMLALGTWGYLTFKDVTASDLGRTRTRPLEHEAIAAQAQRLHFALSVFHALRGTYPPSLEGLVDEGLLQTSDLEYPPGPSSIVYQRIGDTYQLVIEKTVVMAPNDVDVPRDGTRPSDAPSADPSAPETD